MIDVKNDFNRRSQEIESYLNFISKIENDELSISYKENQHDFFTVNTKNDLLRTYKSSAFLLLYNLVESTLTNAIAAIFDSLALQQVGFDECSIHIKRIVLSNLKTQSQGNILDLLITLNTDIISKTFIKERIFSGNIDALEIRNTAKKYGFRPPSANGEDLLSIKRNRNDLAHGVKSFADVGRDYTVDEIIKIKNNTITYLKKTLNSISNYINNKEFLS